MGIDGTTLEANAAMRSIVRRDNGASYEEFLKGLARESGIPTHRRGKIFGAAGLQAEEEGQLIKSGSIRMMRPPALRK